jgi:Family of unknown function (DUF5995)
VTARALALAAVTLALATSCGSGTHRVAPERTPWTPIAATLSGPLRPTSPNPCNRGAHSCLAAIVAEMERRFDALAATCDHKAAFALMYLRVTQAVDRDETKGSSFADRPYLAHLDAVFARLYFNAIDAWTEGRHSAVPAAWQVAFEAADAKRVSGVGDLLLGMNAHISRDLPFAVAAIGDLSAARRRSFEQVNAVLEQVSRPMLEEESRRFDPTIAHFTLPILKASFADLGVLLGSWRNAALRDGERLLDAPTPAARAEVAASIEQTALARAALIVAATSRVSFSSAGRARDAFCRSH